jgi:hypothetical protein
MDRQKENAVLEKTPVPVPLCPPQIPRELGWVLQTTLNTEMMPFHTDLFPYSTIQVTKSVCLKFQSSNTCGTVSLFLLDVLNVRNYLPLPP